MYQFKVMPNGLSFCSPSFYKDFEAGLCTAQAVGTFGLWLNIDS